MKPVYLRFAGIHSYVEEQQIDFTELLGTGVFGIFGPTGSGKSTILDAITLALYGSVDRATRHTQGILNQYSRQLAVAFTFELAGADGTRRYRVERTFKRGKTPESVEAAQARLLEVDCGTPGSETAVHVLADKAGAVTDAVQQLLGLSLDDFKRAVVLPQGKFAEFLLLKDAERRNMLQRLFRLDMFGDRLAQRVKERLQKATTELQAAAAERAGIGDASPAALQEAEKRLAAAEESQNRAAALYAQVEKEHATWAAVWGYQEELKEVEQHEKQLAAASLALEQVEREWQAAERAEPLRKLLQEQESAASEYEAAVAADQAARAAASAAATNAAEKNRRRAEAEQAYAAETPVLFGRRESLLRAIEQEKEQHRLALEAAQCESTLKQRRLALAACDAKAARAANEAEQLSAQWRSVQQEIAAHTVDPDTRELLQKAVTALERLDAAKSLQKTEQQALREAEAALQRAEKQAKAAEEACAAQRSAFEELQARKVELEQAKPVDEQELSFRRGRIVKETGVVERLRAAQRSYDATEKAWHEVHQEAAEQARLAEQAAAQYEQCERQLVAAREALSAAQEALIAAERSQQAAVLSAELRPGTPCPVCGSLSHPHPASAKEQHTIALRSESVAQCQQAMQAAEEAVRAAGQKHAAAQAHLQAAQDREQRLQIEKAELEERMRQERRELPEVWQGLHPEQLKVQLEQAESDLAKQERRLQDWQNAVQTLNQRIQDCADLLKEAEKKSAAAESTVANCRTAVQQATERLNRVNEQVEAAAAQFRQVAGDRDRETVQADAKRLADWDRKLAVLQRQAQKLQSQEEEARQRQRESEAAAEAIRREIAGLEVRYEELRGQAARLAAEIAAVAAPEQTVQSALTHVEARLAQLEKARTEAITAVQAAGDELQQALQAQVLAAERVQRAERQRQQAQDAVAAALAAQGFARQEEAVAALRSAEERQRMKAHIESHQQEVRRWQQERERLEKLLAGRTLSADEWQTWQERLAEASCERDRALEEVAVAKDACKALVAKHQRWLELSQREAELTDLTARLQDISSLLRGNALVEFVAEQQLEQVAYQASGFLGQLTRYRYALEVGSDGSFVVRDNANGGFRRGVQTLSGGETFLTSLALALALSSQIQLRGRYPLQFFFLDEGFGSLDQELLDVAMTALERLHMAQLHVGIISHVPELRNRIMRRLVVSPAVPGERGSVVRPD